MLEMEKNILRLLLLLTAVWIVLTDSSNGTEVSTVILVNEQLLNKTGGTDFHTAVNFAESLLNYTEETENYTDKHETFLSCPQFVLEPNDYVLFSNNTVYVEAYNKTLNSSFFQIQGQLLIVCAPDDDSKVDSEQFSDKYPQSLFYITIAALGISIACLSLHLLAFCVVPDLRNLPGWNLASLCLAVLLGDASFLVAHAETVQESGVPCIVAAALIQFFYIASFLWSSIMAFDIYMSLLKATGKLRLRTTKFSCKRFSSYCLYSWGVSLLFVIVALLLDNLDGVPYDYRPLFGESICWYHHRLPLLFLFAAPIFIVIGSNIILFGLSAYTMFSNRMETTEDMHRHVLRKNCVTYLRLALIMGMDWIVGVIATSVNAIWLWYLFVLINSSQGLFIFLAFTCTSKVKKCIREKFHMIPRRFSAATVSPTFQSYYNYGSSDEADLKVSSNNGQQKTEKV